MTGPDPVLAALDRLPPPVRQVVVLHELAGLSVEALAERLGLAPARVQARLATGLHLLAALLSGPPAGADRRPDHRRHWRSLVEPA